MCQLALNLVTEVSSGKQLQKEFFPFLRVKLTRPGTISSIYDNKGRSLSPCVYLLCSEETAAHKAGRYICRRYCYICSYAPQNPILNVFINFFLCIFVISIEITL